MYSPLFLVNNSHDVTFSRHKQAQLGVQGLHRLNSLSEEEFVYFYWCICFNIIQVLLTNLPMI